MCEIPHEGSVAGKANHSDKMVTKMRGIEVICAAGSMGIFLIPYMAIVYPRTASRIVRKSGCR